MSAAPRTAVVDRAPREGRGRGPVRTEIQALRALAVALVVVYHLRPDVLPGGFVGVDVFFVISGFLISGHLLREIDRTGKISLTAFWAARARRILPAALVTIAVVVLTGTFVLPPSEWEDLQTQALASVFYVENWILASQAVDYLGSDDAASPFQHFWSLGVEEQFYLFWPLLFLGAGATVAVLRGRDRSTRVSVRGALLVLLGLVVFGSFVWSSLEVRVGHESAYFATAGRLWELGVGGLLALVPIGAVRHGTSTVLRLIGLGLIAWSAVGLSATSTFPGPGALPPVVGALLVIAAGRPRGPFSFRGAVESSTVQRLGDASYSIYLWHFPVIVYFGALTDRVPSAVEAVGLVLLTSLLAVLSYTQVEQRFRWRRPGRTDMQTLRAAAVAMVLVAALTAVVTLRSAVETARWDGSGEITVTRGSGYGAEATEDGSLPTFVGTSRRMVPPISSVGDDAVTAFDEQGCSARGDDPPLPRTCSFGPEDAAVTVALVGDSHARMFGSPLVALAAEEKWRLVTYLRDSCPFSTEMRTIDSGEQCLSANEATLEELLRTAPDAVITVSYAASRFRESSGDERPGVAGTAEMWDALEDAGIEVVAVKDVPQPDEYVVRCVTGEPSSPRDCGRSRDVALRGRDIVDDVARHVPEADVVDLTNHFCGPTLCPPVIGNVIVYRDTNHITDTYARSLTPYLAEELAALGLF